MPGHDDHVNTLVNCGLVHPNLYRCSLISNPDLHYIQSNLTASWLDMDVQAWFVLSSICDDCYSTQMEHMRNDTQRCLEEAL